jgi:hypothetical protein
VDRIEDTLHLVSRFTHDERAADVRLITFHDTAIVNENNAAFADYLGWSEPWGRADHASTWQLASPGKPV